MQSGAHNLIPLLLLRTGGYVSYLVTTRALHDTPGFTSGAQYAVRRRFNDFVALSSALKVWYIFAHVRVFVCVCVYKPGTRVDPDLCPAHLRSGMYLVLWLTA